MGRKFSSDFIKSQLEEIRVSKNAEYSSGIASTLIKLIEYEELPDNSKLFIEPYTGQQTINAIKEVRQLTGLGLREAKDLVQLGGLVTEGPDFNRIMNVKKSLDQFVQTRLECDGLKGVLFNTKN